MEWLTTEQAARMLGVGQRRIRQMLKSGVLEGEKHGGRWRVSSADIARRTLARSMLEDLEPNAWYRLPRPSEREDLDIHKGSDLESRISMLEIAVRGLESRLEQIERHLKR
jgi:excisionase family DNA binding protein